MTDEERIREVHYAEVRALRALRLALTAVHDVWQDIITICGLETDDQDPAQPARTKAWNVFGPLLLDVADDIRVLVQNPTLGELALANKLRECEDLIELKRKERMRPYMEDLERAVEAKRLREARRDTSGSEK